MPDIKWMPAAVQATTWLIAHLHEMQISAHPAFSSLARPKDGSHWRPSLVCTVDMITLQIPADPQSL